MFPRSFRPRLEALEGRWMPSANPALSIRSVSLPEGNSGQTAFVFIVRLSAPSSKRVSVNFRTADASAIAGSDYQAVSGKLQFAPGETSKTITVLVNGDTNPESTDSFLIDLSRARNATIADSRGWGNILDDDGYVPPPPPPPQPPPGCDPWDPDYPNC